MIMVPTSNAPPAGDLHAPLARVLRPLVRLLIKAGITFPMLSDLLRELYVNVAEHDFGLRTKAQTDSRVSLLTGIHRKEVSRLRGAGAPVSDVPAAVSGTGRILARWLGAPDFATLAGPKPLPRTSEDGRPSFESLVVSVTRDVRPRAVLDEWLDKGLVRLDEEDRVVLQETALVARPGEAQQLYYFGRNLHDHMAAAVANVTRPAPRYMERAVHYDRLSPQAARELETLYRTIADATLQEANRNAIRVSDADDASGGTHVRVNFGLYIYAEDETPAADGDGL